MKRDLIARSIVVVLLGILLGFYIDRDNRETQQMGREKYLASEAQKFDDSAADPTPRAAMVIAAVFLTGLFFFVYEVIVLAISAVLKPRARRAGKPFETTSIPFS